MNVLVTGATGFLGRALCGRLREAGHSVLVLSRNAERAKQIVPGMQNAWDWDPQADAPPEEAVRAADAVVHLAGESVAGRWTVTRKRAVRDSRILGTRNLVTALVRAASAGRPPASGSAGAGSAAAVRTGSGAPKPGRVKTLICASAIGYYGDRGNEELTEASSPGSGFLAQLCRDWELEAGKAERAGVRVVCLRTGIVLAVEGGALGAMLPPFRMGAGGPLGSGEQWWSWVHRDDVLGMIGAALQLNPWQGAINATAPQPVRQREFARALGRAMHRPAALPTPAFALRAVLGEFSTELLSSKKVVPQRATQLGYRFQHPEVEPALRAILAG